MVCSQILCTTKLAQSHSQYSTVYPIDTATSAHQNHRNFVAFPTDTATPEDKQRRRFAASPIDTATPERGLAASPKDTATPKEKQRLMFCSFPHRHGIYDAKTTRKTMRKRREKRRDDQLEANKGLAPRPPDYKREPFVTHSGKSTAWHTLILYAAKNHGLKPIRLLAEHASRVQTLRSLQPLWSSSGGGRSASGTMSFQGGKLSA